MLKRYLLFAGLSYYPKGGWGDFAGSFDTLTEALAIRRGADWWHVIDSQTGKIVAGDLEP